MNPNGDLSRCPKHPTQPPFTGFCSACLLERLSAANLPSPPASSSSAPAAAPEITTETETRFTNPRSTRTTLLDLFHLDDMADASGDHLGLHIHSDQQQDPPSLTQAGGDPPLQRKRSLRQSCDWIVCCDTGSDSWLPSRQSWDGSAAAAAAPAPGAAQLVLDRRRNKASLSWNDRRVAKPLRILLKRSLSESWRHGREADEDARRRRTSDGAAQGRVGIEINGGRMDSEISSLDNDSCIHADVHNGRRDSLMKRLYWLGRSRSVHYSSPATTLDTGMLRFHLTTPLSSSSSSSRRGRRRRNKKTHGRHQQ